MAKNSCQKKPKISEILGTKVVQFWCYTKSLKTKNVPLKWYSSMIFFYIKIRIILTLKIDFENQILAFFDVYFWPFNKSHEKINAIFVISVTMASIWNVFIKFRWHDEKLRPLCPCVCHTYFLITFAVWDLGMVLPKIFATTPQLNYSAITLTSNQTFRQNRWVYY